jgi:2-phosphosulfolactate phosphatase
VNIINGRRENSFGDNPKVLVDIYRSTTTMPLMLEMGAKEIIPVDTIKKAKEIKSKFPDYIIAGERYGFKVPGFEMSNSPSEVMKRDLKDKTIIFTSTNGTRVLNKFNEIKIIYICSYVNVYSTIPFLLDFNNVDVVLSGRPDGKADEDYYFGYFLKELLETGTDNFEKYIDLTRKGQGTKRLTLIGGGGDVEYCLKKNTVNFPVIYKNGKIFKKPQE